MTKLDLGDVHLKTCNQARELMMAKNHDYAAGDDIFRNFRRHGLKGILVRLSDKLARLESFEEQGDLMIKTESVEDTVQDIINYAVLFKAMLKEKGA